MPGHTHPQRTDFIDRDELSRLLEPLVPDAQERRFVLRCILDEGPRHHRGVNYVLIALLGRLAQRLGARLEPPGPEGAPVPMRLPPHLGVDAGAVFPLPLEVRPLDALAPDSAERRADMVACLVDGPPQHALANAVILSMIHALDRAIPGPST